MTEGALADDLHDVRAARRVRCAASGMVSLALLSLGATAHAAGAEHTEHSVLVYLVRLLPVAWREHLYGFRNWGQLDVIPNTVFVILLISAVLGWLARRLTIVPETRAQNAVEWLVEALYGVFAPILGDAGRKYLPLVSAYFIFVLLASLVGLVPGFQAPTAELNTTLGLAITSIVLVQLLAIREIGFRGYILHLCVVRKPIVLGVVLFPIELITQVARVLSLSLRLFANIYAKEQVLIVFVGYTVALWFVPVQLPILFLGILSSLVQAAIFGMLTAVYLALFICGEHEEEHGPRGEHAEGGRAELPH